MYLYEILGPHVSIMHVTELMELVFFVRNTIHYVVYEKFSLFGCSFASIAFVYTHSTTKDDCMAVQCVPVEDFCWCSL